MTPMALDGARRWPERLTAILLSGYIILERSFAHVGVPPVYIGELALAAFLALRTNVIFGPALMSLVRSSRFSMLAWTMYFSLAWGVFETLRGLMNGHLVSITCQCFVFHVYPLFVWVGLFVGRRDPGLLRRMLVLLAWLNGVYGVSYVFVLSPLGLTDTTDYYSLGWFGQPNWSAVLILALMTYQPRGWRGICPLLLNGFVLLALQSRASWVGLAVCLPLWALLAGRLTEAAKVAAAVILLLAVGWIADLRLPSPESRNGEEFSVRSLTAQAWAIVDPAGAERASRNVEARAGTIEWRTLWWKEIWSMAHARKLHMIMGPGYGYPIWDLNPFGTDDFPLRTPHNVVMFTLGFTGWTGVALFALTQLALAAALWGAYRRSGDPFGLCLWTFSMVRSQFDNYFETPHFAIPVFLIYGLCLALERPSPQSTPIPEGANL